MKKYVVSFMIFVVSHCAIAGPLYHRHTGTSDRHKLSTDRQNVDYDKQGLLRKIEQNLQIMGTRVDELSSGRAGEVNQKMVSSLRSVLKEMNFTLELLRETEGCKQ